MGDVVPLPNAATPEQRIQQEIVSKMLLEDVNYDLKRYGLGTSHECFRSKAAMRAELVLIRLARLKADLFL